MPRYSAALTLWPSWEGTCLENCNTPLLSLSCVTWVTWVTFLSLNQIPFSQKKTRQKRVCLQDAAPNSVGAEWGFTCMALCLDVVYRHHQSQVWGMLAQHWYKTRQLYNHITLMLVSIFYYKDSARALQGPASLLVLRFPCVLRMPLWGDILIGSFHFLLLPERRLLWGRCGSLLPRNKW